MGTENKTAVKKNYQKELEQILEKNGTAHKSLLLHSCCAPCSSYCLEYLSNYFDITIFYFNPNITEEEEYRRRVAEQQRFINELNRNLGTNIRFLEGEYQRQIFFERVKGYENCKEGGERCHICYELRLEEAAKTAALQQFDYFTTTLTISPLKNAAWLNEIGREMAEKYHTRFLPSDFKKKNGYKRSIELSREYNLYRQDYCGCIYSKVQRESEKLKSAEPEKSEFEKSEPENQSLKNQSPKNLSPKNQLLRN